MTHRTTSRERARMRRPWILLVAALVLGLSATASTDENPDPSDSETRDGFYYNRLIGRGVNLGNALEARQEGQWGFVLKEEYFSIIREAGFDSVRIPVRWSAWADERFPYSIDESFFERIDWAISHALEHGLVAIINIHHYHELMKDPGSQKERFLALWKQIAERYQDRSDRLYFEILNEPQEHLSPRLWNVYLGEALEVIRRTNPDRTVVVGSANYSQIGDFDELELPKDDRNIIVAFHYYEPFKFTHQGAPWSVDSWPWLGTTWKGTPEERKAIEADFDRAAEWGRQHHRPITLGEFGSYRRAGAEDRVRWTEFVRKTAEERQISWSYWEFAAGFGVYDPQARQWTPELLAALVPEAHQSARADEDDAKTD